MRKPLSPTSEHLYDRILTRAFGDLEGSTLDPGVASWTSSNKALLKAAIKRKRPEATAALEALDASAKYEIKRAQRFLTEEECVHYEDAAKALPDRGRCALALLPLASALRADEVLTITRPAMVRASKSGELLVLRKGGEEQTLTLKNSIGLFEDLLASPAATGRWTIEQGRPRQRQWGTLGEVLSPGKKITQYHILHSLVRDVGAAAKIEEPLHPHLLRHACATRLMKRGAPLAVISKFLNHKNLATTQKYLHASTADAAEYLNDF